MEHTFKNGIIMQQYFVFPTNAIINRYKFENKTIFNIDSYTLLIAGG
jgi:tRNA A37 threonylcarbamoyladenosine biosynthesis protein TsaE